MGEGQAFVHIAAGPGRPCRFEDSRLVTLQAQLHKYLPHYSRSHGTHFIPQVSFHIKYFLIVFYDSKHFNTVLSKYDKSDSLFVIKYARIRA